MRSNSRKYGICAGCKGKYRTEDFGRHPNSDRRNQYCLFCDQRTEKACALCGVTKPIEQYSWKQGRSKRPRRDATCTACRAQRTREWNAKYSKTKALNRNLVKTFGLSLDEFNAMLESQNGRCAICDQEPQNTSKRNWRLHVDHCHSCNGVRRLLCSTCNNGLGCFKDNPELLRKAIAYLDDHVHSDTPLFR